MAIRSTYLERARRLEKDHEPYVPGMTRESAARMAGVPAAEIVKLSSNENPLGASPAAKAAITAMIDAIHEYPNSTADALRAAIGVYLDIGADQVVVGAGSSSLMHAMMTAFTEPGGEIVALDPSFSVYREIARAHGRVPVAVPLREADFTLDLETFAAALSDKTQLVFLTRPNNPTSTLIPLGDFVRAARLAGEKGALVVSDEAYIEFSDSDRPSAAAFLRGPASELPHVMVSRTFSKAFGLANLRLGYAIGTRETARALAAANAKWPTGDLAQKAGIAALSDTAHLARTRAAVAEGRNYLVMEFGALGLAVVANPQGNYVMVDVTKTGLDAAGFAQLVFERGRVLVRGDFSPRHVRVSVGTAYENARLLGAVRRLMPG